MGVHASRSDTNWDRRRDRMDEMRRKSQRNEPLREFPLTREEQPLEKTSLKSYVATDAAADSEADSAAARFPQWPD